MARLKAKRARSIANALRRKGGGVHVVMRGLARDVKDELIVALLVAADALEMGEESDAIERRTRRIIREHKKANP